MAPEIKSALIRLVAIQAERSTRDDEDETEEQTNEFFDLKNSVMGEVVDTLRLAVAAGLVDIACHISHEEITKLNEEMAAHNLTCVDLNGTGLSISLDFGGVIVDGEYNHSTHTRSLETHRAEQAKADRFAHDIREQGDEE